jgi:hypothetical protein
MGISTYLNPVSDGIPKGFRYSNLENDFENDIYVDNFVDFLENHTKFIFEENENGEYASVLLNKKKLLEIASIVISDMNENNNLNMEIALKYYTSELFELIKEIQQLLNYCEANPEFQICWDY